MICIRNEKLYAGMMHLRSDRRSRLWICAGLTLMTLVVFRQVCEFDFTNYDDPEYVLNPPLVQGGLTFRGFLGSFTTLRMANWHPLTWLSLMADRQLSGKDPNPGVFHVTNLAWHVANVLLLFLALTHLTGQIWRSGLAAALFAIHPLHVESVAWVAERKDVLSTFFWMLVLWSYSHYVRRPGWRWYSFVLVSFVLGLMSKPMLVTLPCVLLLLDYWPLGRLASQPSQIARNQPHAKPPIQNGVDGSAGACESFVPRVSWRWAIAEKLPLFLLTAAACTVTIVAQRPAMGSFSQYPLPTRMANAVMAYVSYLGKTFWPLNLSFFYRYETNLPTTLALSGSVLFLVGVTIFAWRARRSPWLLVGWLWYLGTLVPVIGLVQVGQQAMADRYTYVPLIGIFIILAWSIPASAFEPSRRLFSVAIVSSLMACLMLAAWEQLQTWRNDVTLYSHALALDPGNWFAHVNLGRSLEKQGKVEEALAHYQAALRANPDCVEAYMNLAAVADRRGDFYATLQHSRKAAELRPKNFDIQNNLGLAWAKVGKFDKAVEHFQVALKLSPDSADANNNLGAALKDSGRPDKALEPLGKAIRMAPNDADAHNNLGSALAQLGQLPAAIEEFRRALELKPDLPGARANLLRALEMQQRGKPGERP